MMLLIPHGLGKADINPEVPPCPGESHRVINKVLRNPVGQQRLEKYQRHVQCTIMEFRVGSDLHT